MQRPGAKRYFVLGDQTRGGRHKSLLHDDLRDTKSCALIFTGSRSLQSQCSELVKLADNMCKYIVVLHPQTSSACGRGAAALEAFRGV